MTLDQWAQRHGVSAVALAELRAIMGVFDEPVSVLNPGASEAAVQERVRLAAAAQGWRVHRNNVGVLNDDRGVPVRFGLANDSAKLNDRWKSSDLIGWRPVTITDQMVGYKIAQFVSIECKKPSWKYTGNHREEGQLRWIQLVNADGGHAFFSTGTLF